MTDMGRGGRVVLWLLLANVLLLAAGLALQRWQGQPRLLAGYNADKVRLLGQPGPGTAERPAAKTADAATPTESPGAGPLCLVAALGGAADYTTLRQALRDAGLDSVELRVDERLGWWVYWPPISDPVEQVQVLAAIGKAGVRDVAPIRRGPMARAISFGMFASEADARAHREFLRGKGLDKLEYGPRPGVGELILFAAGADPVRIERLRALLKDRPGLEERACPAPP
ncbi:MAG: hypothetical protein MUC79_06450 [Thiobacillaceae bacterium]|jgi:hypothetical protein|nr:hypothetical protein [Thiobacillaceae bacterium]